MVGILPSEVAKDVYCSFSCKRVFEYGSYLFTFSKKKKFHKVVCVLQNLVWRGEIIFLSRNDQVNILQVVTDILHLHGKKLTAYKGDYDTFERTKAEQLQNQQKAFESSEKARAHMQVCLFPCKLLFLWQCRSSRDLFMIYYLSY